MITLNQDQLAAVEDMKTFYVSTENRFFLLKGHPGVGKTTTIQQVVKELKDEHPNINVCFAATTNKAVKVLKEMAFENEMEVDCATIHSILGLVLSADGEEKQTRKMAEGNFDEYHLVVIDEISMATKYLCTVIESHAHEHNVKVIMMGDQNQLPPVKEGESPAFESLADAEYYLTKVMRQAEGSPIQTLVSEIRANLEYNTPFEIVTSLNADGEGIHCVNAKTFALWVEENFTSEEYTQNPNAFRCLAWTNKRVNQMNKRLRRLLVGETESPFIVGERVIARQPVLGIDDFTGRMGKPVIKTDEECKVLDIYATEHPAFDGAVEVFKVWAVNLLSDAGAYETAYLLHEDSEHDYQVMCNNLVKAAKADGSQWRHFWGFKDMFADLQPPHAMTVHRSQGSTYDNVFIDMVDIMKNKKAVERTKLLYVGCSRARENLVIMDRVL